MAKQIFNIVRILAVSLSLAVMAAGCIQEEDRILSDEEGKDASSFVSLCFITSGTPVTVNLRGPLIINKKNNKCLQVVTSDPKWSTKHDILAEMHKRGNLC